MSKEIEELIIVIEDQLSNFEGCGMVIIKKSSVESAIDKLRILAKPVQYVVEIERMPYIGLNYTVAYVNRVFLVSGGMWGIRSSAFIRMNQLAVQLSLPPITIDQITFVEI